MTAPPIFHSKASANSWSRCPRWPRRTRASSACTPRCPSAPTTPPPPRRAPAPAVPATVLTAQRILDARIEQLGRSFNGDVGIAVRDIQTGWTSHYDGTTYFPQQSVSKFWVALTALAEADKGQLSLQAPVTVRRDDLTLFHQPIRSMVLNGGFSTKIGRASCRERVGRYV